MKRLLNVFFITIMLFIFPSFTAFAEDTDFDGYIIKFKPDTMITCSDDLEVVYAPEGLYKTDTLEDAKMFEEYAEYIEPNYTFTLDETINTYDYSLYEKQYCHSTSNSLFMQKIGLYGDNVKIGIIDSGIYPHNALKDKIKGGYNYAESTTDYTDSYGHGTAVAGIIAASYGDFDVIGVAPRCELYSLKCFKEKTASLTYITQAIYAAVDTFDVDILNMSIGDDKDSVSLRNAINHAYNAGVIMIASAGNASSTTLMYPAAYSNVIGVGALNSTGTSRATYSNYNTHVYCTAVGTSIKVCSISENTYTTKNGTSFSCPLVTGVIANMMTLKPDITIEEVKEILAATCTDMGTSGYDTEYGYGRINAQAIVNYMLKDRDFYISPKDTFFSNTVVPVAEYRVWKNPALDTNPVFFWNEYDKNGKMNTYNKFEPDFSEGYAVISGSTKTQNTIKTFGLYDDTNIRPLSFLYTFEGGSIEDLGDY